MLRIHFSADDLARVRLASTVDPLWETLLSANKLFGGGRTVLFDEWRRRAMPTVPVAARMLAVLAPPVGYSADFLTPVEGTRDIEAGIDSILSTPRNRLADDIGRLAAQRPVPPWTRQLATGDLDTVHRLGHALRAYYRCALTPWQPTIQAHVDAHLAARIRTIAEQGIERMLSTLHHTIRWEPPVLHAEFPYDRDIHLAGRGLLLVPAFFCTVRPVSVKAPELAPVLVYPIDHDLDWAVSSAARQPTNRSLSALLGATRARVLEAVAVRPGCTTTELAHRVGTSGPSASQHTAVLREAGLLTTRRRGKAVLHTITALGAALLHGSQMPVNCRPTAWFHRPSDQ